MKHLANIDLNQNQLINAVIQKLAIAPVSPVAGQVYYDTTKQRLFYFNGTKWEGSDALDAVLSGSEIVTAINGSTSTIDDARLSAAVRDAIAKAHNTHAIGDVAGLQVALDDKVSKEAGKGLSTNDYTTSEKTKLTGITIGATKTENSSTNGNIKINGSETNVYAHPSTDGNLHVPITGTTNNGKVLKAGAIAGSMAWADDEDTKYTAGAGLILTGTVFTPAFGTTAGTITQGNDSRLTNARTPLAHIHPVSDVTDLQGFLDGKVDNSRVQTDVPSGAKFTETTINGKTGAILKTDITALGIPAQDTIYNVFTTTTNGLVPKSTTSNTTDYLRRDGTWATPVDTKYTLPVATSAAIGGVKSGTDITVDASGSVSVNDNSHNHTVANISGLQTTLDSLATKAIAQGYATTAEGNAKTYTDGAISSLIGDAPEVLDTLHEIAQALNDDPNFVTTITSMIGAKTGKYSQTIGNNALTSILVTHNLGSRNVSIALRETASPYAMVMTDIEFTTENAITLKFAKAPALNEYTATIIG